ncbi:hypothetical protein [Mucilaginibacter paludis]|uniref:Outer membrane protein beta-barrel domain-containing protein n=1 Tax=Mucilaginibacter paludis DSM 18603 TaxID=714943 RepID=H1Y6I3_9SPHI|nr:hypothetical protein [Mucilaginibacter paludis]EHQ25827.1 hypothetical protein Mucpa_1670 [Mucilaginibacter paludis DSM 18603]
MHTTFKIFITTLITTLFFSVSGYCQLDYNYGLNTKGFRLGIGGGGTVLQTHFAQNPIKPLFVANLDYDFNPYLSIGVEYQKGTLHGDDSKGYLFVKSSDIEFSAVNLNLKVSVGQFVNYQTSTVLGEAIKRFYAGVGIGGISEPLKTKKFQYNLANRPDPTFSSETKKNPIYVAIPLNFGTNINLRGLFGMSDKFELNPNYQFTYVNTYYLDGFRTSTTNSHLKGFYNALTLSLKYKF